MKCSKNKVTDWGWKVGTKIEMEHTKSRKVARRIAGDHLCEFGDKYYVELLKMEKKLRRDLK